MKIIGPRSLATALKAVLYTTFGLGVLFLFVRLGDYGLALSHAENLENYRSTSFYRLPAGDLGEREWRSENGRVRLKMHRLYGELRHLNMPRRVIAFLLAGELLLFLCFFVALVQLANLFEALGRGEPFPQSGARRLRRTGIAVAAAAILSPVWEVLPLWLFHGDLAVRGATVPWLSIFWIRLNPALLLAGLLLVVVSEAFRVGHDLAREQRLTI